jgi:hypothetical protein
MSTIGRNSSRRTWRLIIFTAFLSLLCMALVQITLNAAARADAARPPASQPDLPGAIKDDPTVAPDAAESADNNVTFPVDI